MSQVGLGVSSTLSNSKWAQSKEDRELYYAILPCNVDYPVLLEDIDYLNSLA